MTKTKNSLPELKGKKWMWIFSLSEEDPPGCLALFTYPNKFKTIRIFPKAKEVANPS